MGVVTPGEDNGTDLLALFTSMKIDARIKLLPTICLLVA